MLVVTSASDQSNRVTSAAWSYIAVLVLSQGLRTIRGSVSWDAGSGA